MGEQERVLHYDKMATACAAHFPPLGPDSLRSGEERGASCCSKLKTDQRKMPQRATWEHFRRDATLKIITEKMAKKDNCGQREQAGEQHTHTHIHTYVYLLSCVCVCVRRWVNQKFCA